jgi:hypothetical protein
LGLHFAMAHSCKRLPLPPRQLIEATNSIALRALKRNGQVRAGDAAITLCSVANGQLTRVRLIHLERPVFGGVRTYFLCPVCDRQCEFLYSRSHIACRLCHQLAFASENELKTDRMLRQLHKRRDRLGQTSGGVISPFPGKPKWWRWPTYLRTRRQGIHREREYWQTLHLAMVNGKYLQRRRGPSLSR